MNKFILSLVFCFFSLFLYAQNANISPYRSVFPKGIAIQQSNGLPPAPTDTKYAWKVKDTSSGSSKGFEYTWNTKFNKWDTTGSGTGGTVTSLPDNTANGITATWANRTTTPTISLTLGNITPSQVTINGTSGTGYVGFKSQTTRPTTPPSGQIYEFMDSLNQRAYINSAGRTRSFNYRNNPTDVIYYYQNIAGGYTVGDSSAIARDSIRINTNTTNISNEVTRATTAEAGKQATLVNQSNIKSLSINGGTQNSLLGSGNLDLTVSGSSAGLDVVTAIRDSTDNRLKTNKGVFNTLNRSSATVTIGDSTLPSQSKVQAWLFGDSYTADPVNYYPDRFCNMMGFVQVNRGTSSVLLQGAYGDSSGRGKVYEYPNYSTMNGGYLILQYGTNDIENVGSDTATGRTALNTMIDSATILHGIPANHILIVTPGVKTFNPANDAKRFGYIYMEKDVAAKRGTLVLDLLAYLTAYGNGNPNRLLKDGIHLNAEGSQLMANGMANAITSVHGGNATVNGMLTTNKIIVNQLPNVANASYMDLYDTSRNLVNEWRTSYTRKNLAIGLSALAKDSGFYNIAYGWYAGASNKVGNYGTFTGYLSGNANDSASGNTYYGYLTGQYLKGLANSNNTIVGSLAASTATKGYQNLLLGSNAMYLSPDLGYNQIALGQSLQNNNGGYQNFAAYAMTNNTTGNNNFAWNGYNANTTGRYGISIGLNALNTVQTVDGAIGIGRNVFQNAGNSSYNITAVGDQAGVGASGGNPHDVALFATNCGLRVKNGYNLSYFGSATGFNSTDAHDNALFGNSIAPQNYSANYLTSVGSSSGNVTQGITNVTVTNGGTGYTTATIAFSGVNGATATVNISGGVVVSVTIVNLGFGATGAVTGTITGDGTGATVTVTTGTGGQASFFGANAGGVQNAIQWSTFLGYNEGSTSKWKQAVNKVILGNGRMPDTPLFDGTESTTIAASSALINGSLNVATVPTSTSLSDSAMLFNYANGGIQKVVRNAVSADAIITSFSASGTVATGANVVVNLSAPSSPATLTLPTGSSYPGQHIVINNITSPASANQWSFGGATVLEPSGSSVTSINSSTNYVLENMGGSSWMTVSKYSTATNTSGLSAGYVEKTSAYTLVFTDYTVRCTANTFTITTPAVTNITGKLFNIINTGSGTITVSGANYNGASSITLNAGHGVQIQAGSTDYVILSQY